MTFKIRSYQRQAIDAIKQDWQDGYTDVLLTMGTGGGKTVVFLQLLDEVMQEGQRALILSHRKELVTQPYERLGEFWPHRRPHTGIVMAQTNEAWAQIVIATVQTLQSQRRLEQLLRSGPIDYLVVDECFPADTLVDGRPIETICVGDTVTAWDKAWQQTAQRRVTRVFRRPAPQTLIRIETARGALVCTSEHPLLVNGQWRKACDIRPDDFLLHVGGCNERDSQPERVRVERVVQRDGCACPDGHVYNLEVEHLHTYTANGFVVHNCHHAVADSYRTIIAALRDVNPNLWHVGVTATPIRSDDVGLRTVYQKESAHFGIKELVKLGYLAPPRWLAIQTGISLAGIRSQGSGVDRDFNQKQLANVFETDNCFDLVVESHKRYAADRQSVAFTVSVAGAYELAETFNRAGISSAAADATTATADRQRILNDFRRGKYQVIANAALWTEGLDLPEIACVHMVRPTQSDGLYTQCVGRALRLFPGKSDALLLDYAPLDSRNIAMLGDVLGVEAKKDAYIEAKEEAGEVVAGFTFDGNVKWLMGNPMEIVSCQLDYLDATPWRWARPDGKAGPMVLGLGPGEDGTDRTLVISRPAEQMDVWLVAKRDDERWHRAYHVTSGTFEACSEWANTYADERGNAVLARKQAYWRASEPSEGQVKYAARLGIYRAGMNKGQVAEAITCKLALGALRRKGIEA